MAGGTRCGDNRPAGTARRPKGFLALIGGDDAAEALAELGNEDEMRGAGVLNVNGQKRVASYTQLNDKGQDR